MLAYQKFDSMNLLFPDSYNRNAVMKYMPIPVLTPPGMDIKVAMNLFLKIILSGIILTLAFTHPLHVLSRLS